MCFDHFHYRVDSSNGGCQCVSWLLVSHRASHCHILPKHVITVSHCVQRSSNYPMEVSHGESCHGGMSWLIDACHEGVP